MTGMQSEAQLPFAGLHQLVLPVLDQADMLPTPQRAALLAAFGMAEAAEAPDRFLVALAVLELLSDAAEHAPLLVVAEDAHWLDRSSADVLAFVARRVEHEPLVVLVASRDSVEGFFDEAGLPSLSSLRRRASPESRLLRMRRLLYDSNVARDARRASRSSQTRRLPRVVMKPEVARLCDMVCS